MIELDNEMYDYYKIDTSLETDYDNANLPNIYNIRLSVSRELSSVEWDNLKLAIKEHMAELED